ncbi:LuxR C-terminal-related transcriptional regulator [Kitasatospora purpeofusca]|uniref:LuxR C-terminal-related transcriptional regulator n=1 Tax=Kitasatospora purpeofusca TaxID=67352 RepID=UPI002E11373A|nr:LuxR C-terminal-related transcriptional regulator [Kitasatospora purpeofusca]WSR41869.1 LuxR C-terminal-related transcriptional regulator [Kitasatospora purpeofusca]
MPADPVPALAAAERRLIVLASAGASFEQIAADPETRLRLGDVRSAIEAVLVTTGNRTVPQLAGWATAHRIVTQTVHPSGALTIKPSLAPRLSQVLRGWAGGRSTPELTADFGISSTTMRSYTKTLLSTLNVDSDTQAVVVGVLAKLLLLSDVNLSWPAEPLARTAGTRSAAP